MDISKHLMLLFIADGNGGGCRWQCHFKTSHVIVYRDPLQPCLQAWLFQNISCYCLSAHALLILFPSPTFQNISCYCLSVDGKSANPCKYISKHLMLLFIKESNRDVPSICNISKHLMLLFISRISALFSLSPPLFPLYFLYFSIFYQPTPLSWTALLIIP